MIFIGATLSIVKFSYQIIDEIIVRIKGAQKKYFQKVMKTAAKIHPNLPLGALFKFGMGAAG